MEQDIFKIVKEKIDYKEVVKDILGAPEKEGTTNSYHSPFCEGDNDPSFKVSDTYISDFSDKSDFGKGRDIFNFIVAYNNITHFISDKSITDIEALKWLANEYNLDVNISGYIGKAYKLPIPFVETKTNYTFEKSEHEAVDIWTMFDTEKFKEKPSGEQIAQIKNRINELEAGPYMYSYIIEAFKNGQTCIPSGLKSEKDWVDGISKQQMFLIDIDNTGLEDGKKKKYYVGDEKHITVEKILDYCVEIKLVPTLIYYTLSHSEEQHRFRLVYILNKAVDTKEDIKWVYNFLTEKFKCFNVDTAPTSVASLFLGGKAIAHKSDFFYTLKKAEEKKANYNALETYNKILEYTPYIIYNHKLCIKKQLKKTQKNSRNDDTELNSITANDNDSYSFDYTEISNYITYVDKKTTYKNGTDSTTFYHINCIILDNPYITLEPQNIEEEKYIKGLYFMGSSWNKYAIIRANRGNIDKMREVTQIFSKYTMTEETVYTHMGFKEIKGNLCYLYHGGVIGNQPNINVDLSRDSLEQYSFTNKEFKSTDEEYKEIRKAIELSYSMLDLADYSITVPLISITYLSPIYSILKELNILADFILYIQGKSGTRKSSLSALFLNHFGKFNRDNFPCTFRDTLNTIEKKAYILKDTLNVIDDYNPEVFGTRKLDTVEKLFGMYGDRAGRGRMSQDGISLKKSYYARGLCIITGETIPEVAQSRIARSLIINIKQDSINLATLSNIQDNSELLSFSMRKYIELIISHEEKVKENLKSKYKEYRSLANSTVHGRTSEIVIILKLGFYLFSEFISAYEIIDEEEKNKLILNANYAIDELATQQSKQIEELKPTEMFFNAFEELLATQSIYVDRICDLRIQQLTFPCSNPRSEFVGYYDTKKDCYYLFPQIIYHAVLNFYSSTSQKFPINDKNLWKYLEEEGFLYRTDKSRYTVQRQIYGKSRSVVEIKLPKRENDEVRHTPFF